MANYCDPMKIWVLVYKDKVLVKDAVEAEDAIIIKFPSSEPSVYNPMVGWDTDGASIKEGYLFISRFWGLFLMMVPRVTFSLKIDTGLNTICLRTRRLNRRLLHRIV